jgi:2-C-methyl-D-erythritol 4-phosphate cytidylyltransferase
MASRYLLNDVPPPLAAVFPPPHAGEGQGGGISVMATQVTDTCKEVSNGVVRRTVPRDSLVMITGPWMFSRAALTEGLARIEGREDGISGLVDFSEAAGLKVQVVLRA